MEGDSAKQRLQLLLQWNLGSVAYFMRNAYRIWWGNLLVKGQLDDW